VSVYEAPAKLNLSLLVRPPRDNGHHPLVSSVQTIEWCDRLEIQLGEGHDEVEPDIEDNLITRALASAREFAAVPPLKIDLHKEIPMGAGLGGGSSDAAATLVATSDLGEVAETDLLGAASRVGADVPLFLTGGTLMMSGIGEVVESVRPAGGFAVAVVVPDFRLSTKDVYQNWDRLEGPEGDPVEDGELPPSLRGRMPMRNDLLPAALDLEPRLGDFIADVKSVWGTAVCLTGSGSACFGYFATVAAAADAASAVAAGSAEARGLELRRTGVRKRVQDTG
jgi:4-diphosphocytidyl-2-C-methyl-D-erythritol kinase